MLLRLVSGLGGNGRGRGLRRRLQPPDALVGLSDLPLRHLQRLGQLVEFNHLGGADHVVGREQPASGPERRDGLVMLRLNVVLRQAEAAARLERHDLHLVAQPCRQRRARVLGQVHEARAREELGGIGLGHNAHPSAVRMSYSAALLLISRLTFCQAFAIFSFVFKLIL